MGNRSRQFSMRFQDRVSQAIWELQRAGNPPLKASASLEAFDVAFFNRPPNVQPAIDILQSLTTLEAHDYIAPNATGSKDAEYRVADKMADVIARELLRAGLVEIEIGDMDVRGYPVRARVRVMKSEPRHD
jgi:hypothetical protein